MKVPKVRAPLRRDRPAPLEDAGNNIINHARGSDDSFIAGSETST
jgi:hypothetical protein